MTRHIENLARLHNKMRARYGDNDPLVEDLKQELEQVASANAVAQALPGKCPAPAFAGSGGFPPQRRFGSAPSPAPAPAVH